MSLIGCWSPALDPLWASPLVTLPHTQLLAAHPHEPAELLLQSSDRYAAMREPSTPAFDSSDGCSTAPWAGMSRKSLQAYASPAATVTPAIP